MASAETSGAAAQADSSPPVARLSLADGFHYARITWDESAPSGIEPLSAAGAAYTLASRAVYASRGLVEILQADATCRESATEGGAEYSPLTSRIADQLYVAISILQHDVDTALDQLAEMLGQERAP